MPAQQLGEQVGRAAILARWDAVSRTQAAAVSVCVKSAPTNPDAIVNARQDQHFRHVRCRLVCNGTRQTETPPRQAKTQETGHKRENRQVLRRNTEDRRERKAGGYRHDGEAQAIAQATWKADPPTAAPARRLRVLRMHQQSTGLVLWSHGRRVGGQRVQRCVYVT